MYGVCLCAEEGVYVTQVRMKVIMKETLGRVGIFCQVETHLYFLWALSGENGRCTCVYWLSEGNSSCIRGLGRGR